jgi:serine-type D-Ala-D-Ala carboxypeptidase/endopeptidase (penicillin-binding protein 4)
MRTLISRNFVLQILKPQDALTRSREWDNAIPPINQLKTALHRGGTCFSQYRNHGPVLIKHQAILMEKHYMLRLHLNSAGLGSVGSASAFSRQDAVPLGARGIVISAVVTIIVALAAFPAHAGPSLNARLDAIVKRDLPPNFQISIQVADLQTGRVLMEKNPDLPLIPASTTKVATSTAALHYLGPDFKFVTDVLVDGKRGASVRNIYLRGSGDPYLVTEELFRLTRKVRDLGLDEVRGNIIVDDSYFIPGKPLDVDEQLCSRAYDALYSALSLNFNSIKIMVRPAHKPGEPAMITTDPVSDYATFNGGIETIKGNKPLRMEVTKKSTPDGREIITINGTIGVDAPPKGRYVNVAYPALYTGEVFKELLLREGIIVRGKVLRGRTPSSATSFLEFPSKPLGLIVYGLNKFSNNFMAEQIGMALGAYVYGAPGTRKKGLAVIRKHLLSCGVDVREFSLSEASGLSRSNRLSASALVHVLLAAAHSFSYSPEFMASLGVAGVDGTLKDRFTDQAERRRLRAKTGTLRGVTAMAGYGLSINGRKFAFALLINSMKKGAGFIHYCDKIMAAILDTPLAP